MHALLACLLAALDWFRQLWPFPGPTNFGDATLNIKLPPELKDAVAKAAEVIYWAGVRDGAVVTAIAMILLYLIYTGVTKRGDSDRDRDRSYRPGEGREVAPQRQRR